MKVVSRKKKSNQKKAIREKNSPVKVRHKKVPEKYLQMTFLKMKLDEEFFGEKVIYDTLANIPGIRRYFLLQSSFLAFWYCRVLTKAPDKNFASAINATNCFFLIFI